MGIYTNGEIYGVKICIFIPDKIEYKTIYQKKYDSIMTQEQIMETKKIYENIEKTAKIYMAFYIRISDIYGGLSTKITIEKWVWWKCRQPLFEKWLNNEDITDYVRL